MIQNEALRSFFNIPMQFAIPFAVCALVLLFILILRKRLKPGPILLTCAVFALSVILGTIGFTEYSKQSLALKSTNESALATEQKDNNFILCATLIKNNSLNSAESILDSICKNGHDDAMSSLFAARLAVKKGDFATAAALFSKTANMGEDCSEELSIANELKDAQPYGNESTMLYLREEGINPDDYGIAQIPADEIMSLKDELNELVDDNIEQYLSDKSKSTELSAAVKASKSAARLYNAVEAYNIDGTIDEEELRSSVDSIIKAFDKSEPLQRNGGIRLAVIKAYVVLGEWKKIGKMIDEYSGEDELIIATELHRLGLIKEKDFSDGFIQNKTPHLDEIISICRTIYDETVANESSQLRKAYKEKLEYLESYSKGEIMNTLVSVLGEKADASCGESTSKAYLEMAKAVQSLGNDNLAEMYLEKSFGTVSYCTDDGYTVPMTKLLGIVNGKSKENSEDIKNVSAYVNDALENSLPENISSEELYEAHYNEVQYDSPEGDEAPRDYSDYMTDTIVQMTAVLNIGSVDVSAFPTVTARVQINSPNTTDPEELSQKLNLVDCGSNIEDFKLEKVDISTSRVVLVCDVSGSMSGSVDSLQNAITTFADELEQNEEVYIIGFDDSIVFRSNRFLSDKTEIADYADKMGAFGGTDMYEPLKTALNQFPVDATANNIVILMTDGADNNPKTDELIRYEITPLAERCNATVYTLGLGGSVNAEYLETIADAGNGSFLYVDSDTSLENFYNFIHGQLANQYTLTYTAKNTTLNERTLEISLDDCVGSAKKTYYLVPPEMTTESTEAFSPYTIQNEELAVHGLSTKLLYMSSAKQTVTLLGNGFDAGDDITVRMSDNVEYVVETEYIDANSLRLTLPANVATGVYTFDVYIRGNLFKLEKELTVAVQGKIRNLVYGDYEFTAFNFTKDSNGNISLDGNVTMNGWLHFKGPITISGDYLHDERLYITDNYGAYVNYSEAKNSSGLAKYLSDSCMFANLPSFGNFYISNAPYSPLEYADFDADKIDVTASSVNLILLEIDNASYQLYPDVLRLNILDISCNMPFQKEVLKNIPKKNDIRKLFEHTGDAELRGLIGATDIGVQGKLSYGSLITDKKDKREVITMVSLPLRLKSFDLQIDTLANNYNLDFAVTFLSFSDMSDTLNLNFGVKNGKFDSLGLRIEGDATIPLIEAPIPITMGNFGFGLEGFSNEEPTISKNVFLSRLLNTEISFVFDINAGDVTSHLKPLKKFFDADKIALVVLKDCTISTTLAKFRLNFECDLSLFGKFDAGHAEVSAGVFPYSNTLLGINADSQYGLSAKLTIGDTWEATQCSLTLNATGEICVGYPTFLAAQIGGEFGFDIGWWIFNADFDIKGDVGIGLFMNSYDEFQFTLAGRGSKDGKTSGFNLSFTPSTNFDVYTY